MVVVEARSPDGKLIEVAEVSLSQSTRIMITDDGGNCIYVHRAAWLGIVKAVSELLHAQSVGLARTILEIQRQAQHDIDTSWAARTPSITERAMDDIIDVCNSYIKQEEH